VKGFRVPSSPSGRTCVNVSDYLLYHDHAPYGPLVFLYFFSKSLNSSGQGGWGVLSCTWQVQWTQIPSTNKVKGPPPRCSMDACSKFSQYIDPCCIKSDDDPSQNLVSFGLCSGCASIGNSILSKSSDRTMRFNQNIQFESNRKKLINKSVPLVRLLYALLRDNPLPVQVSGFKYKK